MSSGARRVLALAASALLAAAGRGQETTRELSVEDFNVAREAWTQVDNATYTDELAVVFENDRVQVTRTNDTAFDSGEMLCWIVSEQTNDADDNVDNFDLGVASILSIEKGDVEDDEGECGCAFSLWGWCLRYEDCDSADNDGYKTIGKGYTGFVSAYNGLRHDVWKRVNSTCDPDTDTLMIVGYSRGGALANLFGFAVYSENLWDAERVASVTFGSPRVLVDDDSDSVHDQYYQLRLVYREDPIPGLPPSTFGFKHFGDMHCYECSYEESRDAPTNPGFAFSGNVDDHLSYGDWFY